MARKIIANKLLMSLTADNVVALLLTREHLDVLIDAVQASDEYLTGEEKAMLIDLKQLRSVAFPVVRAPK